MSAQIDLSSVTLAGISPRIRNGDLSPVALTEHSLQHIASLNPRFNAFITVTAELARSQARDAEREIKAGHWRGSLHGVPVAVKDFYDTAGIRTTAAFEHFANRVPSKDADMVVSLRNAGAVLVGKTNMHQLGMGTTSLVSHFGPVVNPRSPEHVAGGSSGGSAAAVAAGLCFATVDTDAIGSGRLPAAICGVICFKPSFGVLSTAGILAGEQADPAILLLSHPSVMARTAEDVSLAFDALVGKASGARPDEPRGPGRIGIVRNFTASEEIRRGFDHALAIVRAMKVDTREIDVPFSTASFDVKQIEQHRAAINATLFRDVDAIVLPTLAAPVPTVEEARAHGDRAVSADNTFFANYFGLPAISMPIGVHEEDLPFGLQIVGPAGGDDHVLNVARAVGERSAR